VASEAELDDKTGGELLLGGMNTELQNAWGASSEEYEDLEVLAQWAIRKKNQAGDSQTYPRITTNKEHPKGNCHATKPRQDISTHQ